MSIRREAPAAIALLDVPEGEYGHLGVPWAAAQEQGEDGPGSHPFGGGRTRGIQRYPPE
jgi:hypothetical protein